MFPFDRTHSYITQALLINMIWVCVCVCVCLCSCVCVRVLLCVCVCVCVSRSDGPCSSCCSLRSRSTGRVTWPSPCVSSSASTCWSSWSPTSATSSASSVRRNPNPNPSLRDSLWQKGRGNPCHTVRRARQTQEQTQATRKKYYQSVKGLRVLLK